MDVFDPRVNDYIARAADFAKPILEHWRELIHTACPEITEAVKWAIPHFDYKGKSMLVMAAYKNHCSFSFLQASSMSDSRLKESADLKPVQRFLGKVTSLNDLPNDDEFIAMIKEAMKLNEKGKAAAKKPAATTKIIETPDSFQQSLNANPAVLKVWKSKSPSFQKEYNIWIGDAKTEATRQKRIDQALEWIGEDKGRFWQYQK